MRCKTLQIAGDSKYGGAGYLLIRWCEYLLAQGWSVDVLATDPVVVAELHKILGVRVVEYILIPREIAPKADLKALSHLSKLLLKEKYDVVHTYTSTPAFLGRIAARLAGVPVILNHQAGWPVNDSSSLAERLLYTPMEYMATLASTRGICVSRATIQQARAFHIAPLHKLTVICNGIRPEPFLNGNGYSRRVLRDKLGLSDKHVLIGSTGRLVPLKDNDSLIQAMALLRSFAPGILLALALAGDGPERGKLEHLIRSLQLQDQVHLLGFCDDIPAFLSGVDIFVAPTLKEGLSVSILEAMAAAKPVVATSILPNIELIEHEVTGLLVPPKSPEQIARAIMRFVSEPNLAEHCAAAARQRVLERYTLDRMFEETWNLYVQLLAERRRATT